MTDPLAPSTWSVVEARDIAADLRQVADDDAYDVVEHFAALCSHLDELYGGDGFTELLEPSDRATVAAWVRQILGGGPGADVVRLDQPVNSALTLAEGREAARVFAQQDGRHGELGRALQGLYGYLDELYGGPGAFTVLLNSEDRPKVAELVTSVRRT